MVQSHLAFGHLQLLTATVELFPRPKSAAYTKAQHTLQLLQLLNY